MTTPRWQPGHLYLTDDLVQPITAAAPAPTTLTNPGFESGVITGWTVTQFGGTGTASIATDKKFAGTYAGRWQGASGTGHAGGVEADWINDTEVPVKPGQFASAAIFIALDDTDSSQNQARARLYWYDASHALLSHTDGALIRGNTSAWYSSPVSGVAPAGAAYARMGAWVTANGSGGVRIDSASWSIVAAAPPAGLIYKAVQPGPGTSASDEPAWPPTLGVQVIDNTVTWEAVQASRVVWEASPICKSGATEPDWPTDVGGFVTDGTISWECISRRIEDPKCPNTTVVVILAGKVFAADGDIVRFSATANPLDWSSADDAGYLPTGLQQANANDMAVLNQYRSNLVAFNASSFQNWQADPDPAAMAILDQMDGIGSTWQHAAQPVANDLFFLSQLGVRSVGIAAGADNLSAGDIGMPIDVLVREQLAGDNVLPLATYYPGAGQYWLAFGTAPQPTTPSIVGNVPDGTVGDTGTLQYVVSGGIGPYGDITVLAGSLPPGATMDTNGLVSYDYTTAGSYGPWTVGGVDANGTAFSVTDSAVVAALPSVPYDETGIPYKFMYAANPDIETDYSSPSYDDSAWATGQGGFGWNAAPAGAQTIHTATDRGTGSRIWLRQTVSTMIPGRDVFVEIWRDDGAKFWWNGVNYPVTPDGALYYRATVTVPGAVVTGNDLAALRVTDGNPDNDSVTDVGSPGIYASMNFTAV